MTVKKITFDRSQLKHTNFKNGYHKFDSMSTTADKEGQELPESVIKVLYKIYEELNKEDKGGT